MRRNKGSKQPITQHPFFPAIVALWCGALFGLCSIALRPAIIEKAILASGLDTLVPMAAPPLGTTFRILFALAMTVFGVLAGGLLARRIVRNTPATTARRRKPETEAAEPAKAPAFAAPAEASAQAVPGRRRALANMELEAASAKEAEGEVPPASGSEIPQAAQAPAHAETMPIVEVFADTPAPTSAHGEVQSGILDVREFDLDSYLETSEGPNRPESSLSTSEATPFEAPDQTDDLPAFLAESSSPTPTIPEEAQVFRAPEETREVLGETASPVGQRLFDAYSQAIAARTAPGGPANAPSYEPLNFSHVPAAGATPGFSLLGQRGEADGHGRNIPTSQSATASFSTAASDEDAPGEVIPFAPSETAPEAVTTSAREDEEIAETAAARVRPVLSEAAERIATSELDELSHLELLERLALAMSRRREEIEQGHLQADPVASDLAEIAQPVASTAFEMPVTDPAPETAFKAEAETEIAPNAEPAPFAMPTAFAPEAATADENTAASAREEAPFEAPAEIPARKLSMPAAMRPVDLDAFDDEDDALPGYIPPRHIAAPQAPFAAQVSQSAPLSANTEAREFEDREFEGEDFEDEDERVLEEGYSSLLDLSRPSFEPQAAEVASSSPSQSGSFVRIEEPENTGEIEPVVIFPGEEAQRSAPPYARRFDEAQGEQTTGTAPVAFPPRQPNTERLFDAPPRKQDADETEKALRSALATLQRMSGAA